MAHWLEEEENRQKRKKDRLERARERILLKKESIKKNYLKNKGKYNGFIAELDKMVEGVNNMPLDKRKVFGKISSKSKKTKLDNQFHFFGSSSRFKKRKNKGLFSRLKLYHYKHIRVIYFSIAKEMDKVEIETKESYLIRERKKERVSDEKKSHDEVNKHEGEERDDRLYIFDIDKLNRNVAMYIIDWLVFIEDIEHLPFESQGIRIK